MACRQQLASLEVGYLDHYERRRAADRKIDPASFDVFEVGYRLEYRGDVDRIVFEAVAGVEPVNPKDAPGPRVVFYNWVKSPPLTVQC